MFYFTLWGTTNAELTTLVLVYAFRSTVFAEDRHALLAKMPWFRAPGYRGKGSKRASGAKYTKASAERELAGATGEAGSFVVRVIEGENGRKSTARGLAPLLWSSNSAHTQTP